MFRSKTSTDDRIEVPERVIRRARQVPSGTEVTWIEGTMAQIGSSVVHHRPGDNLLDEAIMGAEAVLALLHEMRRREG
jgi:ferritin-like metal-binding protein YciE